MQVSITNSDDFFLSLLFFLQFQEFDTFRISILLTMRNALFISLLVLTVLGCGQSVDGKPNAHSEKQSVITPANSETNAQTISDEESIKLTSKITCPKCGFTAQEQMPTDVCQIAYTCKKCTTTLHPKEGDCCVFCTYGDHKCPSKQ